MSCNKLLHIWFFNTLKTFKNIFFIPLHQLLLSKHMFMFSQVELRKSKDSNAQITK